MSTQADPEQASTNARPDDGGSAFPVQIADHVSYNNRPGMSLRDYFAAAALQGMLACPQKLDLTCENAYRFADMMIAVRADKGGAS